MDDLHCNSLKCRKALGLEICPACETTLPDPDDIVQTFLNPGDAYKTSVLSGLTPSLILDIASRAMNFWSYQVQQESAFQALMTKDRQERVAVLEAQCSTIRREATSEITLLKERLANAERDLALERRKVRDLQETHKANAKAYNKLKSQYDKAKQRALLVPGDSTAFASAAAANAAAASRQPFTAGPPQGTPLRSTSTASFTAPNRVNLGWGAHLQGGQGGGAGVPLAHNPGNSGQRPRRSLHDQENQGSGGAVVGTGFGGGAGFFGAGAGGGRGIAPMPHQRSGGSNASGSSGGGSGGGNGGGGGLVGQPQQQQMPEYLGQQSGGAKRGGGGFRPAAFGAG
ncbi:hypothetical protein BCR35DRAFT_333699 [Leucosporidium creatinivorum]|uniref:E3 ubiquitin-protein ligase CCNB1IP1 n=1 Tax=Leucosporidium creatinivorum TaxID=106004 RepID=A0A1Y2EQI8_9BASI|nr:hypothetical protein BCR35DRAFT_333699 [Leucosporidium creatinivorum]